MPGLDDIQVLIPYRQLESLLTVSRELEQLRFDVRRCNEQLDSCRMIQTEILEKYQELYKML